MKTAILTTLIVACAMTAAPLSADEKTQAPGMTMSMDKQMAQMQANIKTMQQQMDKLRATTDPKEKQKLMQEHMQTMQDSMTMMRGMGGPTMQGGRQHGGMGGMAGMGGNKDGASGDMAHRHDMMVERMDMMQMMMEQMMQHDQMMQSTPAK